MEDFSYPIKLEPLDRPRKPAVLPFAEVGSRRKSPGPRRMKSTAAPSALALREIRERNGVSLEHIAEETRIPLRHLEELERGDIGAWPAGVYARSWARDYAALAGVDADRVVALVAPAAAVEPSIEEIKDVTEERERAAIDGIVPITPLATLMRKVAVAAVVVALMVIALVYLARGDSRPAGPASPLPVGTTGTAPGSTPAPPPQSR